MKLITIPNKKIIIYSRKNKELDNWKSWGIKCIQDNMITIKYLTKNKTKKSLNFFSFSSFIAHSIVGAYILYMYSYSCISCIDITSFSTSGYGRSFHFFLFLSHHYQNFNESRFTLFLISQVRNVTGALFRYNNWH